jgi:hypothetical protein
MKIKSVKSLNPCKSVIQMDYDIVKAHGGELTVEKRGKKETVFLIKLPI